MEKDEILSCIDKIKAYAKTAVSEKRYNHSVRVAETSSFLCSKYGLDPDLGYLAGIAHDICKNTQEEEMINLVSYDGEPVSEVERNKISLLHGRAAAVLIQKKFGISDKSVIQAVARHTMGGYDLCDLAKIVYVADKVEPGRPQSTEEYRENLFSKSLNDLTISVLEENFEYLKSRGKVIAPTSMDFYNSLKKSGEENK